MAAMVTVTWATTAGAAITMAGTADVAIITAGRAAVTLTTANDTSRETASGLPFDFVAKPVEQALKLNSCRHRCRDARLDRIHGRHRRYLGRLFCRTALAGQPSRSLAVQSENVAEPRVAGHETRRGREARRKRHGSGNGGLLIRDQSAGDVLGCGGASAGRSG